MLGDLLEVDEVPLIDGGGQGLGFATVGCLGKKLIGIAAGDHVGRVFDSHVRAGN